MLARPVESSSVRKWSVCTTWGVRFEKIYLLDVYRARLSYPELKKAAMRLQREHSPFKIVIEDKGSGISLIQDLRASICVGSSPTNRILAWTR